MKLRVGERELETLNWSIGGFRTHGLDDLEFKDRCTGKMERRTAHPVNLPAKSRVDDDGARAVCFVEIDLSSLLAIQDTPNA